MLTILHPAIDASKFLARHELTAGCALHHTV
jgi:hypothetical protein